MAGNEIYYPVDGSTVDFTAYYPYKTTATFGTALDIEIGDQTKQPDFDLLWTRTISFYI